MRTNSVIQVILSMMVTAGFFFCLYYLLTKPVPVENKEVLYTILGSLGTVWVMIMNYYFGSTSSSRAKDQTIQDLSVSSPVNIPNAKTVSVATEKGDVNVQGNN